MATRANTDTPFKDVGRRLVAARLALGLTQEQIRKVAGATKAVWSRFETGARLIKPEYLLPVSEKLGVDPNYIYLGRLDGLPEELRIKLISEI